MGETVTASSASPEDKAEAKKVYFDFIHGRGIGPILADTSCKFIKPITYPDSLIITASVDVAEAEREVKGGTRFRIVHSIVSEAQQAVVATGEGVVVVVDYKQGKRALLPKSLLQAVRDIETADGIMIRTEHVSKL